MAYYVAQESKAKCTCCNVRYADYNVRVSGSDTFTEQYCNECKANHIKSLKFPGKDLIYSAIGGSHPTNPEPPKKRVSSRNWYGQCDCCQFYYYETALTKFQFECKDTSHSKTCCLECAADHRSCRHDYSIATMPSLHDLLTKLMKVDTYKGPITPYEY